MKRIPIFLLAALLAACNSLPVAPTLGVQSLMFPPTATATMLVETPTSSLPGLPIENIHMLKMIDAQVGWALGGLNNTDFILRTTDGGATWQDVTPPGFFWISGPGDNHFYYQDTTEGLDAVLNGQTAWAIDTTDLAGNTVWRTDDGGRSWRPGTPLSISGGDGNLTPQSLAFQDAQHGMLADWVRESMSNQARYFFRTVDGGITWQTLPLELADVLDPPVFVNAQVGWARRSYPSDYAALKNPTDLENDPVWKIQRTTDGGDIWQDYSLPLPADLVALLRDNPNGKGQVTFSDQFERIASGVTGIRIHYTVTSPNDSKTVLYISDNAGQSWKMIPLSGDEFFLDQKTGWQVVTVDGKIQLEQTTDSGDTWQTLAQDLPQFSSYQFIDLQQGWAIPKSGGLLHTSDGGRTWSELQPRRLPPESDTIVKPNSPSSAGESVMVPQEPAIARLAPGTPIIPHSLWMMDEQNGWEVGQFGYLFHTTDGGRTWQDVTPHYGSIAGQRVFFAVDARRAWASVMPPPSCQLDDFHDPCPDYYRTYGPIWFTTDAGQTWHPTAAFSDQESFYIGAIQLQFLDPSRGWAQLPSSNGILPISTSDGGASWQALDAISGNGGIVFVTPEVGFRTETEFSTTPVESPSLQDRLDGKVLPAIAKTTDGGRTWQVLELPKLLPLPADINLDDPLIKQTFPNGLDAAWRQNQVLCSETIVHPGPGSAIGLKYSCSDWPIGITDYYLSLDQGQTWNSWTSAVVQGNRDGYFPFWPVSSETFLPDGTGWRLYTSGSGHLNQVLQTRDGGQTWTAIQKVAWPDAQFYFIDDLTGWAIVNGTALVHTGDGGKTWTMLPLVVSH